MNFARYFTALLVLAPSIAEAVAPAPAFADEGADYWSFSVYTENDLYALGTKSDKFYTTGQKLTCLSPRRASFEKSFNEKWAAVFARRFDEKARDAEQKAENRDREKHPEQPLPPMPPQLRLAYSLGQNIYTPANIHTSVLQTNDRPYAAWLYVNVSLQARSVAEHDRSWLSVWGVDLGMIGPWAYGGDVQNWVHDHLPHPVPHADGWANQLHNEPGLNLVQQNKYRWCFGERGGFGADAIGHWGFSLGNVATYANTGLTARIGFALPDDFGPDIIRAGADTSQAGGHPSAFGVHLFGGFDVRAVGRDIALDGNTFRPSHHIAREVFVGDFQFGLSLNLRRVIVNLSQVRRTPEFKLQDHAQSYGSITITFPISGDRGKHP